MHPKFIELGLGGDRHWLSDPISWLRVMGNENWKRNWFSQNLSNNDPKKNMRHDFYDISMIIFVKDKMTKTGTANLSKCAPKFYF